MLMQLNTVQWISLPSKTRLKLVEIFNIPRSKFTEVEGNVVVTDGHTNQDLEAITIEAMQGFLLDTTEEDFFKLFHKVLEIVNTELAKQEQEALQLAIEEMKIKDAASEQLPVPEPIINTNEETQNEQRKETSKEQGTDNSGVKKPGRTRTKAKKS